MLSAKLRFEQLVKSEEVHPIEAHTANIRGRTKILRKE
jgi:hypothetical protein